MMMVYKKNLFTGKQNCMLLDVTEEQLEDWKQGNKLIQDALPHLNTDEREFLLSGTLPADWEQFDDIN